MTGTQIHNFTYAFNASEQWAQSVQSIADAAKHLLQAAAPALAALDTPGIIAGQVHEVVGTLPVLLQLSVDGWQPLYVPASRGHRTCGVWRVQQALQHALQETDADSSSAAKKLRTRLRAVARYTARTAGLCSINGCQPISTLERYLTFQIVCSSWHT
jgi:hypothetical protein